MHLPPLHPRPDLHLKYLVILKSLKCDRSHRAAQNWADMWDLIGTSIAVEKLTERRQGVTP